MFTSNQRRVESFTDVLKILGRVKKDISSIACIHTGQSVGTIRPRQRISYFKFSFIGNEHILRADISYLIIGISGQSSILILSSTQSVEQMPQLWLLKSSFLSFILFYDIIENEGTVVITNLNKCGITVTFLRLVHRLEQHPSPGI